jgi:hypothetical protein
MKKLFKIAIYLIVILLVTEVALRLLGYGPMEQPSSQPVTFMEPDGLRGWVHVPGQHEYVLRNNVDTMHFLIDEHGERITRKNPSEKGKEEILLIGCSFTMGMGLDDDQTFAWKLQQEFPKVSIRNLGVGAYGTYQSLLVLKDQLLETKKPRAVVYGLIDHHLLRNIAEADWLHSLDVTRQGTQVDIQLPYVHIGDNNELVRGEPIRLVRIPLARQLALCFMTQRVINNFLGRQRVEQADRVLKLLLIDMQKLCEQDGVSFYVNLLYYREPLRSELISFLDQNNIAYINSHVPLNAQNTFQDDGHPKEEVNEEWAQRIRQRLLEDGIISTRPGTNDKLTND